MNAALCHLRLATLCSIDTTACSALSAAAGPPCGVVTAGRPWGMAFRERLTAAPRRLAAGLALCGMPAVQSLARVLGLPLLVKTLAVATAAHGTAWCSCAVGRQPLHSALLPF